MVQSGLYAALVANTAIQNLLPKDPNTHASLAKQCVNLVRAPKQPGDRFIVIYVVEAPPAATSMDGTSEMTDAEVQFDCFAEANDPNNAALKATQISAAVRGVFENFSGELADGTVIRFYSRPVDFDGGYEQGATGYLSKRILRLRAFYSEAGEMSLGS